MSDYPPIQTVSGVVISVEGPSLAEVTSFSLRANDGRTMSLLTDATVQANNGGLPLPHLREHLVSGAAITVEFVDPACAEPSLIRYTDAPTQ
jgi:hypothetical protein